MTLLAIDTSSSVCVLGVRNESQTWVDEAELGRSHSQEILPRIEALLSNAGIAKSAIQGIVYGQGPGSFTGLRIGIGVVQGLAYGLRVPVVGISSLKCLAQRVAKEANHGALVALAARNTEVYFGAYCMGAEGLELLGQEGVFEASEVPNQEPTTQWVGLGNGWSLAEALQSASGVHVADIDHKPKIRAADLLDLGEQAFAQGLGKQAVEALPEYLRETVAAKPKPR